MNQYNFGTEDDNNPFSDFLEASPQAAYYSYSGDWGSPRQSQYYQNQFSNIYLNKLKKDVVINEI